MDEFLVEEEALPLESAIRPTQVYLRRTLWFSKLTVVSSGTLAGVQGWLGCSQNKEQHI